MGIRIASRPCRRSYIENDAPCRGRDAPDSVCDAINPCRATQPRVSEFKLDEPQQSPCPATSGHARIPSIRTIIGSARIERIAVPEGGAVALSARERSLGGQPAGGRSQNAMFVHGALGLIQRPGRRPWMCHVASSALSPHQSLHRPIHDHHGPNRRYKQASKTATPGSIPGSPALVVSGRRRLDGARASRRRPAERRPRPCR